MVRGRNEVEYGTPTRASGTRSEKGRRCAAPDCPTVLSTYNRSATCYLHSEPTRRHALERS